ncbi:uncharacterized protein LOC142250090 [Anomaloglossus baeobatrachus]|uniref:uncharacterized protein LOC142250090 n=1 Tax=Anomaloglossus baeobatrachus TaxID=238106 RepID=UPI003F4F4CC6
MNNICNNLLEIWIGEDWISYSFNIVMDLVYTSDLAAVPPSQSEGLGNKIRTLAIPLIQTVLPDCTDVYISSFTKGPVVANCLAIFPTNNHMDEEMQKVFDQLVLERSSMLGDIAVLFNTTTTVAPTTTIGTTKSPIDDPGRMPKRRYPCCPPTVARSSHKNPLPGPSTTSSPTSSGTTTKRSSTFSTEKHRFSSHHKTWYNNFAQQYVVNRYNH